jgi:hypothetical protein
MNIEPADAREPLRRLVGALEITDSEMRAILKQAARESALILKKYSNNDSFSAKVRAAQLDLARVQREMWAAVGHQTRVAIGDGVDAAAASHAFLDDVLMSSVGGTTHFWREALMAQARAGIPSLISRRINNITLSDRVYRNNAVANGQIGRMLDGLLLSGASAKEIAKRVIGFIDPDTPGGASYAAMRLGRSELNNAFHTTSIRMGEDSPFVVGQKWTLSGSHPKTDVCNELANRKSRLGAGVYAPGDVPPKPHPQCLCYVVPVTPSQKDFIRNFNNGAYDDYLNRLGCRSA